MPELSTMIAEAAAAVRLRWTDCEPRLGIILGTGLSSTAQHLTCATTIDYESIPHFPRATATSHEGRLICGELSSVPVLAMSGRFHLYEGYTLEQITFPVRVMHALGVEFLVISNASGGLNPRFSSGDIVLVEDHINLMFSDPDTAGLGNSPSGPACDNLQLFTPSRFWHTAADCSPYDPALIEFSLRVAQRENFAAYRGVYVAVKGPNLETRAEYRLLRQIGGDVVGMSTVPEALVAAKLGLRVLALSTVTNVCLPDILGRVSGDEIVDLAAAAEPKVRAIIKAVVANLNR